MAQGAQEKEKYSRSGLFLKINPFGKGWKNIHGEIGVAECGDSTFRAPAWSAKPEYSAELFSITKDNITKAIRLDKHSCYLAGKNPEICNLHLDHPSISRQHAAFIHSKLGVTYLVDLNSSHGTFNGKNKINPKMLFELRNGSIVRFAGSSRTYIFRAYLNKEQAKAKFENMSFLEEKEEEDSDPCSFELCLNTSSNSRVSYPVETESEQPSKKRARTEENGEENGSKTIKSVTFKEEPDIIPAAEYEDAELIQKVGTNNNVVGKFASLVSTQKVISSQVSVAKPGVGPRVHKPKVPVVSAAERRRRQAMLMDHTRSMMPVVVAPPPPPPPSVEERRPEKKPQTKQVEEEEDEDGPMDLRKA